MAGESISIPILTPGADAAARNIKQVGDAAAGTGAKLDFAAASLKAFNDATAKSVKADATLVQSQKAHAKATALLADAENVLAGRATTTTKLFADQQKKLDDSAKSATGLAARFSALAGTGGATGGGMGAAIIAGAALSPVIATLSVGLGGLALAALGAGKNSKLLAQEMAPLKADVAAFQKELQPIVLYDFAKAAGVARTVLREVEPVAAATGKALGVALGQVGAEFRSGEWQGFFGFMARTAGPDIQLLTANVVDLLKVVPPLTQDMQPLARGLLVVSDDAAKAAGGIVSFYSSFQKNVPVSNQHTINFLRDLDRWTVDLTNHIPGAKAVNNWLTGMQHALTGAGAAAQKTAPQLQHTGAAAAYDSQVFAQEAHALNVLAGGYTHALTPLENYIGAQITERNDLASLNQALKLSHDAIGLKTQAERNSFSAAQTYIADTIKQGNAALGAHQGIDAQIRSIEQAIPRLESVRGKTALYRQELGDLKSILDKLRAEKLIQEKVSVSGSGSWHLTRIGVGPLASKPLAAGGVITGGTPGRDSVPIMAMPGEVVVPTGMVRAGAVDHLRGSLPGFAAGGIIPSYHGSAAGLPPWTSRNQQATIAAIGTSIAKAMANSFANVAATGAGGAVSGGAVEALARRMFPWPSYMWTDFTLVESREAGWNTRARNPSSGAYGLAQFINGPSEYYQWGGNPNTAAGQLTGMFNYIHSRYGNPLAAWGHELSYGWYDRGGWLKPGLTLAYNATGRPEMVVPNGGSGSAGGQTVIVNVNVGHGTHPVAAAREIAKILNAGAHSGVKLRTSILGPG